MPESAKNRGVYSRGFKRPTLKNPFSSGRPDSVSNCTQQNHSADTIVIHCEPGFDGGLTQLFTLEIRYLVSSSLDHFQASSGDLVRNVTTLSRPEFEVTHLEPGTRYEARIYPSNRKGCGLPVTIRVSTLKRPSEGKRLATASTRSGMLLFTMFVTFSGK